MAYPIICLIILGHTICSFLLWYFLYNKFEVGVSVARAKDANESIIKLIQSIYIGLKTSYLINTEENRVIATTTIIAVNWNCIIFLIES